MVVRLAAVALGDRLSLVTDAVAALGAPPGSRTLGSLAVDVAPADVSVRLADGTLAGSTLALDRAVRNLMAFAGLDLAAAVRAVTATPASVLGLADRGAVVGGGRGRPRAAHAAGRGRGDGRRRPGRPRRSAGRVSRARRRHGAWRS